MEVSKLEINSPSTAVSDFHIPSKTKDGKQEEVNSIYSQSVTKKSYGTQNIEALDSTSHEGGNVRYKVKDRNFSFLTDLNLGINLPPLEVKDKFKDTVRICYPNNLAHAIINESNLIINKGNLPIQSFSTVSLDNYMEKMMSGDEKQDYMRRIGNIPELTNWATKLPKMELTIPQLFSFFRPDTSSGNNNNRPSGALPLFYDEDKIFFEYHFKLLLLRLIKMEARNIIEDEDDEEKDGKKSKKTIKNGGRDKDLKGKDGKKKLESKNSVSNSKHSNDSSDESEKDGENEDGEESNKRYTEWTKVEVDMDVLKNVDDEFCLKKPTLWGTFDLIPPEEISFYKDAKNYGPYDIWVKDFIVFKAKSDVKLAYTQDEKNIQPVEIAFNSPYACKSIHWLARNKESEKYNQPSNYTTNTEDSNSGWSPLGNITLMYNNGTIKINDMKSQTISDIHNRYFPGKPIISGFGAISICKNAQTIGSDFTIDITNGMKATIKIIDQNPYIFNDADDNTPGNKLDKMLGKKKKIRGPDISFTAYVIAQVEKKLSFEVGNKVVIHPIERKK